MIWQGNNFLFGHLKGEDKVYIIGILDGDYSGIIEDSKPGLRRAKVYLFDKNMDKKVREKFISLDGNEVEVREIPLKP
jgi:hypothetical protein